MVVAKRQGRDIVEKVTIRLYFPPDTACCTYEYTNMPSQEYRITAEVHTWTRNAERGHTITIMDMEPTDTDRFMFKGANLTKQLKGERRRAVYRATWE